MIDPDTSAAPRPPQTDAGVRADSVAAGRSGPRRGRESAAVKRYVQDTIDVIEYLRAPLKDIDVDGVFLRIAALAVLEALILLRDAMQHNPSWPRLEVPEPALIAIARGREVPAGLRQSLKEWMNAAAEPGNRLYWCRSAFRHSDPGMESRYYALCTHAESAMFLLFGSGVAELRMPSGALTHECIDIATNLRDKPVDLTVLEKVRGLEPREFF